MVATLQAIVGAAIVATVLLMVAAAMVVSMSR
jgi:hypothetical protein